MPTKLSLQKVAQAWCTEKTSSIEMDSRLAVAFAEILDEIWSQPWLGNATTGQLLNEIKSRISLDGKLEYRSVDEK